MTKTILIGWPDEKGEKAAQVVSMPSDSFAKQSEIFEKAKREHVFPKGIKRLSMCVIEERDIAVKIELTKPESETKEQK